ncbi:MAG: response regulator [Pyrinomonadaceae bacterium]
MKGEENMSEKVILLVEDNPMDEELTLRALQHNRISNKVVVARDGAEALDYLFGRGKYEKQNSVQMPQLVLLDLNLPKIDGLEVLRRIRQKETTKHIPVVVLTSSNEESDLINSYNLGANSFVRKPVDFEQFIDACVQLSLFWLVHNQTSPKK